MIYLDFKRSLLRLLFAYGKTAKMLYGNAQYEKIAVPGETLGTAIFS